MSDFILGVKGNYCRAIFIYRKIHLENTPRTRVGPGTRDQTLAITTRKKKPYATALKKIYIPARFMIQQSSLREKELPLGLPLTVERDLHLDGLKMVSALFWTSSCFGIHI